MPAPKQIEVIDIALVNNRAAISAVFRYHIEGDEENGYTYVEVLFSHKVMASQILKADMTPKAGTVAGIKTYLENKYIEYQTKGDRAYEEAKAQASFDTIKIDVNEVLS